MPLKNKKEQILKAASHSFSEKGFWDTHMHEIAMAAGVADGTIFYHFKTKEDLFLEVLKQFKEKLLFNFGEFFKLHHPKTGLEQVEQTIIFYFEQARKMEEIFHLLHRHHYYQIAQTNPECGKLLEDIYRYLINLLEQAITRGQADGSVRQADGLHVAMLLFALLDGLVRLEKYELCKITWLREELLETCQRMLKPHQ